jgi:uncharacterized PurR-regulated membrane protein YhhQ (DUF165 family)
MIWPIIYIIAVLVANYTAIWFVPLPVFGLIAIGTLLFGVTFTARDYAHSLGRPRVYLMILVAVLASSALAVAGNVPWRIVVASAIAIAVSELADTEVYQKLLAHRWLIRVLGSNAISIPLDTVLFNILAFVGVFDFGTIVSIVVGEIIVKFLVGGVVALWRLT